MVITQKFIGSNTKICWICGNTKKNLHIKNANENSTYNLKFKDNIYQHLMAPPSFEE
ncbi:hypothetical protein RhiirA4_540752 [Rhizophagus irregularis]|uniref:Uncharacterized protein n=1 Tax=Rhizophagus irregularis TaxID=588596 RepID=A0A2I1G8G5_9GLOM|nr:hypothetical protein RhiirA4_540752 [Rhizophagus irregularis]